MKNVVFIPNIELGDGRNNKTESTWWLGLEMF